MRSILSVLAVAALSLALFAVGCKPETRDSLGDAAVADVEELTAVLKGVTDNASAEAAKPKVQKIVADMKEKYTKLKAMEKEGPPEEVQAFRRKFADRMDRATADLMRESVRISMNHDIKVQLSIPML